MKNNCTKPNCDCVAKAEEKASGPVQSYPCLADNYELNKALVSDKKPFDALQDRIDTEAEWEKAYPQTAPAPPAAGPVTDDRRIILVTRIQERADAIYVIESDLMDHAETDEAYTTDYIAALRDEVENHKTRIIEYQEELDKLPIAPQTPAVPVWVKCSERMPTKARKYPLRHKSGSLEIGRYDRNCLMYGENWLSIEEEHYEWLDESNSQQVFTREDAKMMLLDFWKAFQGSKTVGDALAWFEARFPTEEKLPF